MPKEKTNNSSTNLDEMDIDTLRKFARRQQKKAREMAKAVETKGRYAAKMKDWQKMKDLYLKQLGIVGTFDKEKKPAVDAAYKVFHYARRYLERHFAVPEEVIDLWRVQYVYTEMV
jgi:hypothetical protein